MGFDQNRFESPVNSEFVCPICHDVLEDPLVISHCEHVFCSACIKDWLSRSKCCPIDRQTSTDESLHLPMRQFRNLLNTLSIRCEHPHCGQSVCLAQLADHHKVCLHNPVNFEKEIDCPKQCGAKIRIHDRHDCVQYLTQVVHKLKAKHDTALAELAEERKNVQEIKNILNKDQEENEDKMANMRQEIEHLQMLNTRYEKELRKCRVQSGPPSSPLEAKVKTGVLVPVESNGTPEVADSTANCRFYSGSGSELRRSCSELEHKPSMFQSAKNMFERLSPSFDSGGSGPNPRMEASEYIKRYCRTSRVRSVMRQVERKHFFSTPEIYKIVSTKKGAHSFSLIYEIYLMELIAPYITRQSNVLDIGSGMGYLTCCMAHMAWLVTGVEHVKDLVNKAQEICASHYKPLVEKKRIQFAKYDGRYGYERAAPYDLIVIEPVVKKGVSPCILPQLKPGGVLIAVVKSEARNRLQLVKMDGEGHEEILSDDHDFLARNHKDSLVDIDRQDMARFDIMNKLRQTKNEISSQIPF